MDINKEARRRTGLLNFVTQVLFRPSVGKTQKWAVRIAEGITIATLVDLVKQIIAYYTSGKM